MNKNKQSIHFAHTIPQELDGMRLDAALAKLFKEHSRSRIKDWIQEGSVTVDGKILRPRDKVHHLQQVEIHASLSIQEDWQGQPLDLNIVYEDASIIVVNKPAGVVVHPGAGNPDHTLVNALLHHEPNLATLPRAGIVHRLDKDTSGLLVVARTLEAHTSLIKQIQNRTMKREYQAVVSGVMISGGTIDAAIGRHPILRKRMAVVEGGRHAITHYRVLERFQAHSHLKILLETGRTHQIRVHLAHIGYPIVGDATYGGRLKIPVKCSEELKTILQQFKRQALHATRLSLQHPTTQETVSWEVPVAEDIKNLLRVLHAEKKPQ